MPFRFTGTLAKLTITIEPRQLTLEDERRLMQESRRNNPASES